MRPDKKKKNRGKYADKSEDTQSQNKNVPSKVGHEKEEATKSNAEKSTEKGQTDGTDKAKPNTSTPANEGSNDNLPPPNLRRETDALKESKKPSKRQIFSDWKEYDQPMLPEVVEEDQLRDFSSLIQQNITEDNYFKFKHERQWENDTCTINKDLFNLNLQTLSAGLQCIPFYERLNISTDLFSTSEVTRMENYAKEQEKVYEGILNSQDSNPIYHNLLEKLTKEPDIQPEEKFDKVVGEEVIPEMIVIQNVTIQTGNELVKCLTNQKQESFNEEPLTQAVQSKVEEVELNFFPESDKTVVEDIARINNSVEMNSKPDQEENNRVAVTNVISISSPVSEQDVKHESIEVNTESIVKPPDIPIDADLAESSAMDMATVFESNPLGQRVKSQRSRDKKAKSKPQVVSHGEEDQILDSLLSLKEPTIAVDDSKKKEMVEVENEADELTNDLKSIVIHDKKENLEAWLDSMLDD